MRNQRCVLMAVTCALAACAAAPDRPKPTTPKSSIDPSSLVYTQGYDLATNPRPERCLVTVYILEDENDQIVVSPEPATTKFCGGPTTKMLFWRLPVQGAYTFPATGAIVFKATPMPTNVECTRQGNDRIVRCIFDAVEGQTYKYALTVLKNGVALPILDPTVFNN